MHLPLGHLTEEALFRGVHCVSRKIAVQFIQLDVSALNGLSAEPSLKSVKAVIARKLLIKSDWGKWDCENE